MDGLRQLDDSMVREIAQHAFAERLMGRPRVPEISTSREQDRAVSHCGAHLMAVVVVLRADVAWPSASP